MVQNDLSRVRKHFRTKISPYLGKLVKNYETIAKQFLPSKEELAPFGTDTPFEEGKDNQGIYGLERIYEDRAVLTPYFECSAYCRYCFKKTRTLAGDAKRMSDQNIEEAIGTIAADRRIKTVLITGGDPLIDPELLFRVLDKVVGIPHVNCIRVGTRNILFAPDKVTDEIAHRLAQYNYVDPFHSERSKNLSVGLSINCVEELRPEVITAVRKLIQTGITVRGQVALLKGVNDSARAMRNLMEAFLRIGMVPYYLFHCMPVIGTRHFRTSVKKGQNILEEMQALSGSLAPTYVFVTRVGKIRLMHNTPLDYVAIDGQRFIKTVTPYKAGEFFEYSGRKSLPPLYEINDDGYIVSHYLDGEDNE
ncbi:MAG: radical SAM protein [Deltaproteobacteria bacterium]|nr:radical SAM protein [Deltaproteobacteria bacterium]